MRAAEKLGRVVADDSAATAVEYAIMASLIAAVIVVAVTHVGRAVFDAFAGLWNEMITYF